MERSETIAPAPVTGAWERQESPRRPLARRTLTALGCRVRGVVNLLFARRPQFVIIGTGRCGTSYAAAYLSDLGIPCSHEGYFTPDGPTLRNPLRQARAKGDVSWLAVPFLRRGDLPIVHLVRRPQDVIQSLYNMGFFDRRYRSVHGDFIAFAERHFDVGDDPFDACVRWYIDWNERCERLAGLRVRIEEFGEKLPELFSHIGLDPTRTAVPPASTFNSWPALHPLPLSVAEAEQALLSHPRAAELATLAERYGYAGGRSA